MYSAIVDNKYCFVVYTTIINNHHYKFDIKIKNSIILKIKSYLRLKNKILFKIKYGFP